MRSNLPALTSLRFFAAAAIFALHAEQIAGFPKGNFAGFTLNQGVSFFYVLSGFILHYNYRDGATQNGWMSFVTLRFCRLWPLHVAGLLLASALAWADIVSWYHAYLSLPKLLGIIFMMHAWSPDNHVYFAINGVSWSLSVEMFFYACFPAVSRSASKSPLQTMALVSIPVAILLFFARATHVDLASGIYNINPLVRLPEFVTGILIAEWRARQHKPSIVNRRLWTSAECLSLLVLALCNWVAPIAFSWAFAHLGISIGIYLRGFFSAIPCAAVIYIFSMQRGAVSGSMNWRPLILLGKASFALYVIHQPIQKFMAVRLIGMNPWELTAACALVTISIAIVLHRLIEIPAYRACQRAMCNLKPGVRNAAHQASGFGIRD